MAEFGVNHNRADVVRHSTYGREMRAPIAAALDWGNETIGGIVQHVRAEMSKAVAESFEKLQAKWTKETIALTYLLYGENWEFDEYIRKKAAELDVVLRKGSMAMRLEELRLADVLAETSILKDHELALVSEKLESRICETQLNRIEGRRPRYLALAFISEKEKQREAEA